MPKKVPPAAFPRSVAPPALPIARRLSAQIADWIRERIAQRQLLPGARLREAQIARELRMSRTPVREAISQLILEGLVTKAPNRSPRVIELTEPMLREVASLRGALEGFGASLAVERLGPETIRELVRLVEEMGSAAEQGEFSRMFQLDYAFHDCIMKATGHQLLYEMWLRMQNHVRLLISAGSLMHKHLRNSARFHRTILTALRARDAKAVQRLMGVRVDELFEMFLAQVVRDGSERSSSKRLHGNSRPTVARSSASRKSPVRSGTPAH